MYDILRCTHLFPYPKKSACSQIFDRYYLGYLHNLQNRYKPPGFTKRFLFRLKIRILSSALSKYLKKTINLVHKKHTKMIQCYEKGSQLFMLYSVTCILFCFFWHYNITYQGHNFISKYPAFEVKGGIMWHFSGGSPQPYILILFPFLSL